jgi:hypothetical protein
LKRKGKRRMVNLVNPASMSPLASYGASLQLGSSYEPSVASYIGDIHGAQTVLTFR